MSDKSSSEDITLSLELWFHYIAYWFPVLIVKGLDTCYSPAYLSQTRNQQRFTVWEVSADWHEPMVPQRILWPPITRANGQLDPRCS